MKTLGETIRDSRLASGLSQEQLAKASGLSVSAIRKIEIGDMEPTFVEAAKIAYAVGASLDHWASVVPRKPSDTEA